MTEIAGNLNKAADNIVAIDQKGVQIFTKKIERNKCLDYLQKNGIRLCYTISVYLVLYMLIV